MKSLIVGLAVAALSVGAATTLAQQQRKYEVDPQTKWAVGAKPTPADELKKQMDAGTVMIIDVRPPANFEKETIPGAINVDLQQLGQKLNRIPKDKPIVVYCRSGARSASAAQILKQAGYTDVDDLGGLIGWASNGYPVKVK